MARADRANLADDFATQDSLAAAAGADVFDHFGGAEPEKGYPGQATGLRHGRVEPDAVREGHS